MSFDRHAANAFQSYVSGALAFSIKRGGLLYGSIDEEGKALVEVIYEPEQVHLPVHDACQIGGMRVGLVISEPEQMLLSCCSHAVLAWHSKAWCCLV